MIKKIKASLWLKIFLMLTALLFSASLLLYGIVMEVMPSSYKYELEIGVTKRRKVRSVDFCDTLAAVLRQAKKEQTLNSLKYGALYRLNYCTEIKEKNRVYYKVFTLPRSEMVAATDRELSFVCLRPDGACETPHTVSIVCYTARQKVDGLENFHFHMLRHP